MGHAIARVLRREAAQAHTGHRPTVAEMDDRYGHLRDECLILPYAQHLGSTAAGVRILEREARELAHEGVWDYAQRRTALAALRAVPASVLVHTRCPQTTRAQKHAAAWIWLELTHGTLRYSPHPASMWRGVRQFDQDLVPEDRLVLLEYGHELLGAVAHDVTVDAERQRSRESARRTDAC